MIATLDHPFVFAAPTQWPLDRTPPFELVVRTRRRGESFEPSPRRRDFPREASGEAQRADSGSADSGSKDIRGALVSSEKRFAETKRDGVPTPEVLSAWLAAVAEKQDREAFARLHGFFAPRLNSWLSRNGFNASTAEEIVQETMLSVWRKAGLYHSAQGGVTTWVFVIARNLRIDHQRRKSNQATSSLDDWDMVDDSPTGEDILLAEERGKKVRDALAKLSREQAMVLQQAYFAEKPQSVIAQELGVPIGTVKSRVRLALARLKMLLEEGQ